MGEGFEWGKITTKKKYTADVIIGVDFDYTNNENFDSKILLDNMLKLSTSSINFDMDFDTDNAYDLNSFINQEYEINNVFYISNIDLFAENLMIQYYSYYRNPLLIDFNKLYQIKHKNSELYSVLISFISLITSTHSIQFPEDTKVTDSFKDIYYSFDKETPPVEELIDKIKNMPNTKLNQSMIHVLSFLERESIGFQSAYTYVLSNDNDDTETNEEIDSYFEETYEVTDSVRLETFESIVVDSLKYINALDVFENKLIKWQNKNQ